MNSYNKPFLDSNSTRHGKGPGAAAADACSRAELELPQLSIWVHHAGMPDKI
jgi:hypothetical protein